MLQIEREAGKYPDPHVFLKKILFRKSMNYLFQIWLVIYRLTHSASELSGFTCTSSLTMNEKFQYRTRPPSAVLKISSSLLVNECR